VVEALGPAVVVNATPVGGHGRDQRERLLPGYAPGKGVLVHDLVYRPAFTQLLRECAACGARVVSGMEMFLAQARGQLSLFTGEDMAASALRAFLAGSSVGSTAPEP
jgi:3-dehydroquinate dehydratase/shikimate dehydrogenase